MNTNTMLVFYFFISTFIISCDKDGKVNYCDTPTNIVKENEIGRIYFRDVPGSSFYYIGGPDSTNREYCLVPCQRLENEFMPEGNIGVLVVYSGILNMPPENPLAQPAIFGIDLTHIKKIQ